MLQDLEYKVPNFIGQMTTEEVQSFYDRIKKDYYLTVVFWGYDEDRYKDHFKCEPLTNPAYDEHEKKVAEARRLRDEWRRKSEYIEGTPYNMFTDAFEKWQSEEAPEKEKLNKYETVFEFLVKEEVDLVERRFFPPQLMDEVVTVITCIDWKMSKTYHYAR